MSDKQLAVIIGADASEFNKTMQGLQGSMDKISTNMTAEFKKAESSAGQIFGNIGKIIATAFAFDKIKDFGVDIVQEAAGLQALDAQFGQIFQGMESEASTALTNVAKDVGALENRIKPAFNQISSFAKVAGMDTAESISFAERATRAAADTAAFYDKSLEDTTDTLQSYLKGNFQVADNLGILSTETTRNTKATEMFGESYKNLDGLQQQEVLLAMYEDANKVSGAMGQAALESDAFENVLGNLKQAWADLKAVLGAPLLEIVVKLMGKLTEVVVGLTTNGISKLSKGWKKLKSQVSNSTAFQSLSNIFNSLKESVGSLWESFNNSGVIDLVVQAFSDLWQAILNLDFQKLAQDLMNFVTQWAPLILGITAGITAFKLITGAIALYNTITTIAAAVSTAFGAVMAFITSPIGLVVLAIGALIAVGVLLYQNWEAITTFLTTLWDSIKAKAEELFPGISELLSSVWEGIKLVIEAVWNGILAYIFGVWELIKSVVSIAIGAIKNQIQITMDLIKGIIDAVMLLIQGDWSGAWDKIKTTVATYLADTFKNIFTMFSEMYTTIKLKVTDIFNAVSEWFGKIPGIVSEKWGEVTTYLSSINLFDIGSNIIAGLWNGVKAKWGEFTGWLDSKIQELPWAAKKILGIESPSKVFKNEIGKFIPEGLAVGIEGNFGSVEKAMSNMNKKVIDTQIGLPETTLSTNSFTNTLNPITAQYVFKDDERTNKTNQMIELLEELVEVNHQLMRKNQVFNVNGQSFAEAVTDDINYQNNLKDSFNRKIQGLKG